MLSYSCTMELIGRYETNRKLFVWEVKVIGLLFNEKEKQMFRCFNKHEKSRYF